MSCLGGAASSLPLQRVAIGLGVSSRWLKNSRHEAASIVMTGHTSWLLVQLMVREKGQPAHLHLSNSKAETLSQSLQ